LLDQNLYVIKCNVFVINKYYAKWVIPVAYFKYSVLQESWLSLVVRGRLGCTKRAPRPGGHPHPDPPAGCASAGAWSCAGSSVTLLQDCCCRRIWDKTVFRGLVREPLFSPYEGRGDRQARVRVREVGPPSSLGGRKFLGRIRSALLVESHP